DQRMGHAVELLHPLPQLRGIEGRLGLAEGGLILFIMQAAVSPDALPELLLERGLRIEWILIPFSQVVEPVSGIAAEDLIRPFAAEDDRDSGLVRRRGQGERAGIVGLLHRTLTMEHHGLQPLDHGVTAEADLVMLATEVPRHE